MIRPEVIAGFRRWQDMALGLALMLFGAWIFSGGTLIWQLSGLGLMALGLGWTINAWRRMRFQSDPSAPGLIEIDEGRVRFLHPVMGGEISLNDLSELKLITLRGRLLWQMRDLSGARLVVPLDSAGAGDLADAFASLPGLTMPDLIRALDHDAGIMAAAGAADSSLPVTGLPVTGLRETLVWTRPGSGIRAL
ncbi:hypothetical protein HOY34_05465 [Xinfangfangia sp. D13-10-4-6]|uniref:hypothetical protein n=1 Tax=Pseudogemmobacter hezensis TaxID=2737662 RepID=UPI00155573D7|nr:hypothetical protein [Pseudogemmobacter hezensis]NPD14651.1 hypothetical protein [Pseudogemmobacter hezensis]